MIGRKLRGRYLITDHLGDGSTATVYKAYDERLGREVAIKMLLPHVRETTRKRFLQEANSAARLNHPNIMSIIDIDEEDQRLFLILEYVDGVSLSKYIPSPPPVVIDLGVQIASALQYAHEQDIIHRDIKPANIKVTPDGVAKIMDMGLALTREAQRVTAHGMVIGTPAYLSPEQAQGQPLDARTDIYSLGIVLYEMVTGQLPFNADDIGALLLQQVKQPPPPPRLVAAELPIELERVILKALEKKPNRRYQSAESLVQALESVLAPPLDDERPTAGRRPGWADTLTAQTASMESTPRRRSSRRSIRIMLADDHTILRKTLGSMLESSEDFVVVEEAGNGEEAIQKAMAVMPDLLLLDLNMPIKSGLEVIPVLRADAPQIRILVLTGRDEDAYIVRALRAGANGYILKSADEADLIEAIAKVMGGELYLGRGVAEKVVTGLLSDDRSSTRLDESERELMLYVAAGYNNEQIARRLDMSMMTIIETLARAMDKLDAKDRHSAALAAIKRGFVLLDDLQMLNDNAP